MSKRRTTIDCLNCIGTGIGYNYDSPCPSCKGRGYNFIKDDNELEDDPDTGRSMCIHGDVNPLTCELCRGESK